MKQLIWWKLHKVGVSQNFLCGLGLHHYSREPWAGLLHMYCGSCKKRIRVATPYSYDPSGGTNKYDADGLLTYDTEDK